MTQEEKAKAYDEAIEWAKKLNIDEAYASQGALIKSIFPELAESEDERIRKELLSFIESVQHNYLCATDRREKWIAYLEKQKELTAQIVPGYTGHYFYDGVKLHLLSTPAMEEKQKEQNGKNEADNDFTIYHPLKNGKGEYECIPYSFYGSLTSFSEDKDLIDFLHNCFYTKEECNEWIEQQKEQKPLSTEETELNSIAFLEQMGYTCIPPGKEPKSAEWSKKINVDEMVGHYAYTEQEGFGKPINCMVRAYKQGILDILKSVKPVEWSEEDKEIYNSFKVFCQRLIENKKETFEADPCYAQKMLSWLKSICPQLRQEWSEEDEKMLKECSAAITSPDYYFSYDERCAMDDWLKSLCPQPHWKLSEEEKKKLFADGFRDARHTLATVFMNYLNENRPDGKMCLANGECIELEKAFEIGDMEKIIKYFKKYQCDWKPSEQEKGALRTAIYILTEERNFSKAAGHLQAILDAFDGKKSRKDWKPNDEQMEALSWLIDYVAPSEKYIVLIKNLYDDLKKL